MPALNREEELVGKTELKVVRAAGCENGLLSAFY